MALLYVALFLLVLAWVINRGSQPGGQEYLLGKFPIFLNVLALVVLVVTLMSMSTGSDSANAAGFVFMFFVFLPLGFLLTVTLLAQLAYKIVRKSQAKRHLKEAE